MNRQQKIRLAAVLLAAALLGTAAGLNLPARVQGSGAVAALCAPVLSWTQERPEDRFPPAAGPWLADGGGPGGVAAERLPGCGA